ncbi:transcriptional regulator with XRE-family HTH domain [Lachnospiraceae bacterium PF1-21]|uniref:helix-turn-helix domain-containing protein n=1 Tax=Ohessyouella blattaphilus TaxID=2949333 RepID=UPI003E3013C0
MFDKEILLKNINVLIKERGLKIGELESKAGVSLGYLSRLHRAETNVIPGIDFISNVAQILNVSIDALISGDFTRSNNNTLYMANFINELLEDTNNLIIEWTTSRSLSDASQIYDSSALIGREGPENVTSMDPNEPLRHPFISITHKDKLIIDKDFYHAEIVENNAIFLFPLQTYGKQNNTSVLELYTLDIKKDNLTPIYSSLDGDMIVNAKLKELYSAIKIHDEDLKITDTAKSVIDSYLKSKK